MKQCQVFLSLKEEASGARVRVAWQVSGVLSGACSHVPNLKLVIVPTSDIYRGLNDPSLGRAPTWREVSAY